LPFPGRDRSTKSIGRSLDRRPFPVIQRHCSWISEPGGRRGEKYVRL